MNRKLTVFICCLLIIGFAAGIGYGCLFKNLFGFECPSCGLSRAWLAVLNGNFAAAFSYHPMFWFPPAALLWCCTKKAIVSKRFDLSVLAVLGVIYFLIYLVKIL